MARGSRRLTTLLLACLAAFSSPARAAGAPPASDPLAAGQSAWDSGNDDEARADFEAALESAEADHGGQHPAVAEALGLLGMVVLEQGDCREAASYERRAVAILEAVDGDREPAARAPMLARLAESLEACGDLRGAERARVRALDAWSKAGAGADSSRAVARCLVGLADDCRKLGRPAEARGHLLRARRLVEGLAGPDDPQIADVVLGLGAVAEDEGDFDRARALYKEAVANRRRGLGPDHPFLAEALAAYARALLRTGNMGDAVEASLEAESIRRAHLRYTVRALPERQALAYESRLVSALGVAVAAGARTWDSTLVERVWDSVVRSRAVVLDEMASRHRWSGVEGDTASDDIIAAWADARQRLAHLAVRGPLDGPPDAHVAALDSLRAQSERAEQSLLARSALGAEGQRTDAGFRDVVAAIPDGVALVSLVRYDDPLAAGASRGAAGGAGAAGASRGAAGDESDAGASGAAADSGVVAERGAASYAAFVTRGRGSPAWAIPLGSADELDSLVTLWRDQVSRPARGDEALGAAERSYSVKLRARLWDPIEARLRGVARVVLVPDGAFHLVNPMALRREDGTFLVESAPTFQIVSSERDLIGGTSAASPGAGFLGIADPDFDAAPSDSGSVLGSGSAEPEEKDTREVSRGLPCVGGTSRPEWERLPGSAREVEEAAALWQQALGGGARGGSAAAESTSAPHPPVSPQARLLLGRAASESAFRRLAGGRRIVHVATHGFFGGACSVRETAGESPAGGTVLGSHYAAHDNPLLGAGLVLAGANLPHRPDSPATDDGILTADEIAGVDLSGVETAVLSGCETGVGVVRAGEGVLGLRRAFEIAGVRTLVLSLWPVTDRAARAWTTRFYQARMIAGLDAAAAARDASRGVLDARRAAGEPVDPIYWAAFIAAGR